MIRVTCNGCGCDAGFSLSKEDAISTWNTRSPVTIGKAVKQVLPGQTYDEGKACQQITKPAQLMN